MMSVFEKYSQQAVFFYDNDIPPILHEALEKYRPNTLLDLGAGDGILINAIYESQLLDPSSKIFAVELSQDRCERIRLKNNCTVYCGSATNLEFFSDQSIDFIISTQVIEHVNENEFLQEVKRVLKPDGHAYIASVISRYTKDKYFMLKHGWKYLFRFYKGPYGRYYCDPTHLREYESLEQFCDVFEDNGLSVLRAEVSDLKVFICDAVIRRIVAKLVKIRDINYIYQRYRSLLKIRNSLHVTPPGYMVCEAVLSLKKIGKNHVSCVSGLD